MDRGSGLGLRRSATRAWADERGGMGWLPAGRPAGPQPATMLTMRPGTTLSLLTGVPANAAGTLSSARTICSTCPDVASASTAAIGVEIDSELDRVLCRIPHVP